MEAERQTRTEISGLKQLAAFRYELRAFLSFSETASEQHGIQAQQYQLLQVIGSLPAGQQPSISYLAERMILRHNSTVELVDRAERAGLVRRSDDIGDARRSLVSLTDQGFAVLERLVADHLKELSQRRERLIEALKSLP